MGVDVSHIIRNDFYNTNDWDAAVKYTLKTIDLFKTTFAIGDDIESFDLRIDEDFSEIRFDDPSSGATFFLHNGFWQIESYNHYCQIVMHDGDYFWLREMIYTFVRLLGQTDVWHAEEFYTWNGGNIDDNMTIPLDKWLSFVEKKYKAKIPEFDRDAIIAQGDVHIPEYESVYHDSLKDCASKFKAQSERMASVGYELLEIAQEGRYARCRKLSDNSIHYVNITTLKPLTTGTPEAYYYDFPNPLIVIKQSGKFALFNIAQEKQLTPFVSEPFKKEWISEKNKYLIINNEAGIKDFFD